MTRVMYTLLGLAGMLLVPIARAQNTLTVSTLGLGISDIGGMIDGVITVAEVSILPVCIGLFAVGGLMWIISPANENLRTKAKDVMIGSLVGVGIVMGARGIMNLVLFFIYGNV